MKKYIKFIDGGVTAPLGFKSSGIHCGIRKNKQKKDLALIFSSVLCDAAAVYTLNQLKGAPLIVTKENLADKKARAVICNSGNANTCNSDGIQKAHEMCDLVAKSLGISPNDVIVASTGVIGVILPIEPIRNNIEQLVEGLSFDGSKDAEEAIMTTDLVRKNVAVEFTVRDRVCRIGGIAKGSGMIHPNMATMLGFLTTDINIDGELLQKALFEAVDDSFNMISVDGDTSTNDMVSIMASGLAGNERIVSEDEDYQRFKTALSLVCEELSKKIAADGEGATKLIECVVDKAYTKADAKKIARAVICSNLLKAAIFGADANWGRVLSAIGNSGARVDISRISVSFLSQAGQVYVCQNGMGINICEKTAKEILSRDNIKILVELGDGSHSARAWGCDLSYEYVRINGDYRT